MIIALGAGVTVLAAVAVLATNLRNEVALRLPTRAPALYLIDVQPQQRDAAGRRPGRDPRHAPGPAAAQPARPRGAHRRPAGGRGQGRGQRRLDRQPRPRLHLCRDACPRAASWWPGAWWPADYHGPPLVSIDEEIAQGYGVGLGDTLTFNVLGRNLEAEIASIRREVDWSGGRLDFLFIVNPSALAGAPHTFVAAADVPGGRGGAAARPAGRPAAQRDARSRCASWSAGRPRCWAGSSSRSTSWPA